MHGPPVFPPARGHLLPALRRTGGTRGKLAARQYKIDLPGGGIGGGARTALAEAGIALYPGAAGGADEQAAALLGGTLRFDPATTCHHHDSDAGHKCGDHGCRDHHHEDHACGGHCGH